MLFAPHAEIGRHYASIAAALLQKKERPRRLRPGLAGEGCRPESGERPEPFPPPAALPFQHSREAETLVASFGFRDLKPGYTAVLSIDGAVGSAELLLNGRPAGSIRNRMIQSELRIDGGLRTGAEGDNLLAVCLPPGEEIRDEIRGITLLTLPKSRMTDIYLRSETEDGLTEVTAGVTLAAGDVEAALGGRLRMLLYGEDGVLAAEGEAQIRPFRRNYWQTVRVAVSVQNPRFWMPDDPFFYRAVFEMTRADGTVADVRNIPVGVRSLRLTRGTSGRGPSLLLNGEPCKLFGAVVGGDCQKEQIAELKALGYNAVRILNPLPAAVEACDALGMLAMLETAFHVRRNPRQRRWGRSKQELPDPLDRPVALLGEMIARYKNSPSVFCWSLGSKGPFGYGVLRELVRSLDDTRAVCCEGDLRFAASDFYAAADCTKEAMLDVAEGRQVSDGRLFGRRVRFRQYRNKPFLVLDASPEEAPLGEKIGLILSRERLLGCFVRPNEDGFPDIGAMTGEGKRDE